VIDFQSHSVIKLSACDFGEVEPLVVPLYVEGERTLAAAKGIRDFVVFTDKRLICVNVQGMSGKKKDFSSLPYSKIQGWSIESAGQLDRDSELELWFSGLGRVHLEFSGQFDLGYIGRLVSWAVLK
jgi:hypothetical protein